MADMELKVRLTGEGGQLVGQLNEVAKAERGVAAGADQISGASVKATAATERLGTTAARSAKNIDTTTRSLGQMRSASTQLGFQIQDITQQLAIGQNPMMVFGQQAGQTAAAIAGMGGAAGRVGTFLAGPWGSLILAGVTILGLFAASNRKAEDSAKSLGEGMNFQRMSAGELIKAIDDLEAAQKRQIRSSYESERAVMADANAALVAARNKREQAKAELEVALARFNGQSLGSKGGAEIKAAEGARAAVLQRQVAALDASIVKAESLAREAQVPILRREVAAATDAAAAATLRYDKAEAALRARFEGGKIGASTYRTELEKLTRTREAETKAAREQEKAANAAGRAYGGKDLAGFGMPVQGGKITSGFGLRKAPTAGASTNHLGIDYAGAQGSPIYATQDGVVKFAGKAGGYGNQIQLNHGAGTQTRYSHLSAFDVQDGQRVNKGQVIGRMGQTGTATGTHLHYEVLVNGKKVDPRAGRFPFDPGAVAQAAEKAAQALEDFGGRASESIQQISERYDAQPRLIDQVARSTRQLDAIIQDLNDRKPEGFAAMIAEAEKAKTVVAGALSRPFEQMEQQAMRAREVQQLILAGREDEARALQNIYQLQDQVGVVTEKQRATILANVRSERELNELLEQRQAIMGAYLGAIDDVRGQLEGLLGGFSDGNFLKNLQRTFKQVQGRVLTEQLFGPALRSLEEYVKNKTGIQSSVDIMKAGTEQAGTAAGTMADALDAATRRINAVANANAVAGGGGTGILNPEFAAMIAGLRDPADTGEPDAATQEIVVLGQKISRGALALTPAEFFGQMSRDLVSPMLDQLDSIFGTEFFAKFKGVLSGALEGYATAGPVGAVLGGLKSIKGLPESLSAGLGKAFAGAQTGFQIAGIGKALGIKTSSTGGAIGGAIGSALPIPGGQIIGSIIGSVVGGLFKKTPKGTVTINGDGTSYAGSGKLRDGLVSAGGSVNDTLGSVAEQLGGELGGFSATIRQKGKKVYANGVRVADLEAAANKIIADALASGAISGLSTAVSKALGSSTDTQKALTEALKVKELEKLLGGFVGSARDAFMNFEKQAQDRLRMATAYGLQLNKVEELNAKERVKLREQLERESFGSLQDLLDRMRSGDLFEGSSVDQRTRLLADIQTTRDAAARGDEGASDRLAELLDRLNTVSKDVYGTTGGFATDRTDIESTASSVIALLKAQLDSADPNATNALLDENNNQNAEIIAELKRLGIALGAGTAPGTGPAVAAPVFDLGGLAYTGGAPAGISGGGARFNQNENER